MNARELRTKYLEFFDTKDHRRMPSDSLVPDDPSLLFTSAGMVQFKPYFLGIAQPPHPRLSSSQKCLRTTDIEEVGNPSHLTFFEMLGNFSIGDYFKREAIAWAWEFLTDRKWLALDPDRLCVSVFETDDEAFELWRDMVGLPESRINRLGEDKNYWPANAISEGPNGPCGPCTEIFYRTVPPEQLSGNFREDDKAGRWLEIWNLVLMQFQRCSDPNDLSKDVAMLPLPKPSIDTGMGLERTARVLSELPSVYHTDTFAPIVEAIGRLAGTDPYADERSTRATRVIADHLRAASFCIADGVLPQNSGRGYVLRRLIRRAVLKGQMVLGFQQPFLAEVFPAVVEALGDHYSELVERFDHIARALATEEQSFRRTLRAGTDRFYSIAGEQRPAGWVFPGEAAFELYDTFGFPLEVTRELVEQMDGSVDTSGYERALEEQRTRSKSGHGLADELFCQDQIELYTSGEAKPFTHFVGYDQLKVSARIVQVSPLPNDCGDTAELFDVALDVTPFYAEAGGQVGDTGTISCKAFELRVEDTRRAQEITWHRCSVVRSDEPLVGVPVERQRELLGSGYLFRGVTATVDAERRRHIVRNHTATHLLHAALRQVLGDHVHQAGSLVAPEYLRFDFTHHQAMTEEQIAEVERIVNRWVLQEVDVVIETQVPVAEAKARGAMALFGEKYGETVRVVQVPGFSIELCGGCHVSNTAKIGLFKIVHEGSVAGGVRRIEALTGEYAYRWAVERDRLVKDAAAKLKAGPAELGAAIERLQGEIRDLKRRLERAVQGGAAQQPAMICEVNGLPLVVQALQDVPLSSASGIADRLADQHKDAVVLVGAAGDGKVTFVAKVPEGARRHGAHAGNLVREIAAVAGGSGGGRPDFAQAGAKDPSRMNDALSTAPAVLAEQIHKEA